MQDIQIFKLSRSGGSCLGLFISALFLGGGLGSSPLDASTIVGDSYQIDGSIAPDVFGPLIQIADTTTIINAFPAQDVLVQWVDEDSFEVTIENTFEGFMFSMTLSDLHFLNPGGSPVSIIGASFNYGASTYDTFFASPDNPFGSLQPTDPDVTWTADSVTVAYGSDWESQLINDRPTLRFDVQTIPEPGSLALTLLALGYFGLRRRA